MNIILFHDQDIGADQLLTISDQRRQDHLHKVLKVQVGDQLRVGRINGQTGMGEVVYHDQDTTRLRVELSQAGPRALPLSLLLAIPRPKMLRRILQTCATFGVKEIKLINSAKVEKSFWQTPFLQPEQVYNQLLLGMEQGGITHLPKLTQAKLFKPFVEDQLLHWAANTQRLVAHPREAQSCPPASLQPTCLAIGPEGGFTDYEVDKLQAQGFTSVSLGARILRVETAIPVAISKLMQL
ncbi:MAG: 16S rRNA (uracil(1498)-N(3))-methyltransferase [Gammaproteobacteria bacterium]|jgi:RsmE family RNA methyltransferase|nr:16S rRNA (uracil(1498)-N(3))-methyltransferase [Gammaproteobacteria bacterium]